MTKHPFAKARQIAARHRELAGKRPLFAKKTQECGALYVYEAIGEDWWTGGGVTAKKVVESLEQMKGVKTLNVFINSEGGDVFEAKAIYANLKRFEAEKVVYVDGIAASAATFIAMAGDRIITAPAATWMVHEAWSIALGRAEDMRAMADVLDLENRAIAETYAKRTCHSVEEMLEVMAAETWMNAEEAKERGFTDEIAEHQEEDEHEHQKAARASPLVALEAQTRERSRLARQEHRLHALKLCPGQPGKRANGQP